MAKNYRKTELWRRKVYDNRAPSEVVLTDDYTYIGSVDAVGIQDLTTLLLTKTANELDLDTDLKFQTGDVAYFSEDESYIMSPQGWVLVAAYKEETVTDVL